LKMPTMTVPWNCHQASHNNMFVIATLPIFRFLPEQLAKNETIYHRCLFCSCTMFVHLSR
jgi:hypothetical protein